MDNREKTHDAIKETSIVSEKYSFSAAVMKQHQETIGKLAVSLINSEPVMNMLRGSCIALAEAIRVSAPAMEAAGELARKYAELYKNFSFTLPKITIPKVEIPPELLDSFKRLSFLSLYCRANWPLFLIDSEELRQAMEPFVKEETPDPITFADAVIEYFDKGGVEAITRQWSNTACLETERIVILQEAVDMYNMGYYYGCTSLLMCQVAGIISSSYYELSDKGIEIDIDSVKSMYESYNSGKTLGKGTEKNIISGTGRVAEKQQLLCLLAEADSGILYWKAAVDYLYNVVFTSDDDKSDHACRNKICHGGFTGHDEKSQIVL